MPEIRVRRDVIDAAHRPGVTAGEPGGGERRSLHRAMLLNGAVWGAVLSVWRILRCNPWSAGGVDDVKPHAHFRYELTPRGFVVPARKD